MSKANQKFVQADEAVSPVIGVILMVAITVVLAAVVFVLVSNLSKGSGEGKENAAVKATSPVAGQMYITLLTGGANVPYTFNDVDEVAISINGVTCERDPNAVIGTPGTAAITGDGLGSSQDGATPLGDGDMEWDSGETIVLENDCGAVAFVVDTEYSVSVTIRNTVILDNVLVEIKSA